MSQISLTRPILFGLKGPVLSDAERAFFRETQPLGFILFQRNCVNPEQVRSLTSSLREAVGREEAPIFIDQEGGRVARLKPPHWPKMCSMGELGAQCACDAACGEEALREHTRRTAHMLLDLGINGNCAPVLDLLIEGADSVIGDRAFGCDPDHVARCGRIVVETFIACGVWPIIKHLPGHGRVKADPHIKLPVVDTSLDLLRRQDFVPFRKLADAPLGMTCHVVFTALDSNNPVSLSSRVITEIIRGEIGFKGLLVSDDLAMGALSMPLPERAARALAAGTDILLYCTGELDEMREIITSVPQTATCLFSSTSSP
ncbi:MAG: glycoside hydrolase family 3 N-terminal domain-containing protein [Alphaproteobacteria bacterium]|nr:glycoside hydrolase family 3 N-terminal domain-containing protein [Alphaproteobacteria bacterium]